MRRSGPNTHSGPLKRLKPRNAPSGDLQDAPCKIRTREDLCALLGTAQAERVLHEAQEQIRTHPEIQHNLNKGGSLQLFSKAASSLRLRLAGEGSHAIGDHNTQARLQGTLGRSDRQTILLTGPRAAWADVFIQALRTHVADLLEQTSNWGGAPGRNRCHSQPNSVRTVKLSGRTRRAPPVLILQGCGVSEQSDVIAKDQRKLLGGQQPREEVLTSNQEEGVRGAAAALQDKFRRAYAHQSPVLSNEQMGNIIALLTTIPASERKDMDGAEGEAVNETTKLRPGSYTTATLAKDTRFRDVRNTMFSLAHGIMVNLKKGTPEEGTYTFEDLCLNFSSVVQFGGDRCSLLFCIGTTTNKSQQRFSLESQSEMSYVIQRLAAESHACEMHDYSKFSETWKYHLASVLAAEKAAGWNAGYDRIQDCEEMTLEDKLALRHRVTVEKNNGVTYSMEGQYERKFAPTDGLPAQPRHVDTNEALTDVHPNATLLFVIPLIGSSPATHIPLCPFASVDNGVEWRPWSIVEGEQCPLAFPTPASPCLPLGRVPVGGMVVTSPATVHNGALCPGQTGEMEPVTVEGGRGMAGRTAVEKKQDACVKPQSRTRSLRTSRPFTPYTGIAPSTQLLRSQPRARLPSTRSAFGRYRLNSHRFPGNVQATNT